MELIAVIVIIGVLVVIVGPRFWGSTFDDAKFFDESLTALRYAHRSAVTMQRTVCVGFAGNTITLTYDVNYGGATCAASVRRPDGAAAYVVTAPSGGGFAAAPTTFSFDRVGAPSVAQTIALNGGRQIVVEAVTGHVHP